MPHPLLITVGIEAAAYVLRLDKRRFRYLQAKKRAAALGRPLVVVGAPTGGLTSGQYTCGDLPCVDLGGCKRCGAPPTDASMLGSIAAPDDSVVIFSSCVLELVPDIETAWAEHLRAAGSPKNIFCVHIEPWTHTTWMYPGTKWRIESAPPVGDKLVYRSILTTPSVAT